MLHTLLLMQAAGTPVPPPAQQVAPPDEQSPPAAQTPSAPPPAYGPYPPPYYYPYPYPPQSYPYPPQIEIPPPPPPPKPEREVRWFARFQLGLGPPGFSEQTDLLQLEGYGGTKFWLMLDGGYFLHRNVGLGAWFAISYWSSSPDDHAPTLSETAYFLGAEVPLKFGTRAISMVFAPRVAFASGELDLGGDVPFQSTFAFGADLSVTSFKYHLTGSLGILRAPIPPPGQLGRDHDLGGFYVLVGGTIDG